MNNRDLINEAVKVVNEKTIDKTEMGGVGAALITDKGTIFKGVCIDTSSGMGFCAEHTAISQMITQGEYQIKKIVAVTKDENGDIRVMSPCGRCREFMYQTNNKNLSTEVVMSADKTLLLKELLPYHNWKEKV
ncbi:MAG: cytidine deaminase [Bacteroidota bacterium]